MRQPLDLASELISDLRDQMGRGNKWPFTLNAEKTQLVFSCRTDDFDVDVVMDERYLLEKSSLNTLGRYFSSKKIDNLTQFTFS